MVFIFWPNPHEAYLKNNLEIIGCLVGCSLEIEDLYLLSLAIPSEIYRAG